MNGPTPIGGLLSAFAQSAQMRRSFRFVRLQNSWVEIVGAAVAAHTRPLRIQDRVLYVAVSSAAWAQNLSYQRQLLLTKLLQIWGDEEGLKDIRFETTGWYARTKAGHAAPTDTHPLLSSVSRISPATGVVTLEQKLHRLQSLARTRSAQLPRCPRCRMGAFSNELERWGMCGSCVVSTP